MSVNPVPAKVRGRILVAAIIATAATSTVLTVEAGLGAATWVMTASASALAAVGTVATALSRANLTLDTHPLATGGPTTPGKVYIVGEDGPEVFNPQDES